MLKIRFLILGLMLGLTALAQDKALDVRPLAPRRAAVLFANQNYQVDQYDLRNSSNDADDMKAALERIGFKVLVYKKDLGRVDLDREIRNLRDLLKGYSVVFFYYSGHGGLYQDENYMIPADVPVLSDNAEVKTFGVSLNGVYAVLREAAVPIGIVVSDACRNLVVSRGVATGMMLPTEGPSGTFTMFATRYGKTARENLKGRNGYFTQELLKHLETPGQTLDELYRTTREGVKVATAHLSERQVPGSVNELDDDYVLVPGKLSITPNPKGQKPEEPLVRPTANRVAVIG